MTSRLTVVANLDRARVSWANSFCDAVDQAGARVVDTLCDTDSPHLFIGDNIPWVNDRRERRTCYFLAAVDGTEEEAINIENTGTTSTVSRAEKSRAYHFFGDDSVYVDGFPMNLLELDEIDETRQCQVPRIGFVGRSDRDKGPELELQIASIARKMGAEVVHISNTMNDLAPNLRQIGAEVFKPTSRREYLGKLATLGCVVNTSPRESLYVSGLEASRLGVPVIAPRVEDSGISDWNFDERFFDINNPEEATDLAATLAVAKCVDVPDISRYAATAYVKRILANLERAS